MVLTLPIDEHSAVNHSGDEASAIDADESGMLTDSLRLIEPIGAGGMGSIWRAEHVPSGKSVAVKLLRRSLARNFTALRRFEREASAAAR